MLGSAFIITAITSSYPRLTSSRS